MTQWRRSTKIHGRSLNCLVPVGLILILGYGNSAFAEDHRVAKETSSVDCQVLGVAPGDTVTLLGTSRGNLRISNCRGLAGNRITIRNDSAESGPLVINAEGTGGFRGIDCVNCENIDIDGTGKWSGAPSGVCGVGPDLTAGRTQCGIQIVRAADADPTTLFNMRGSSKNFSIKGVEIDGRGHNGPSAGIGLLINDRGYDKSDHPGEWRENIVVRNNYFHGTHHEGMYAGPNYGLASDNSAGDLELRNIEVAYNLVEDTGWSGLQFKTAIEGDNSLHHNIILRTGWVAARAADIGHANGLHVDGSHGKIYNNYVQDSGGEGISFRVQYLPSEFGPRNCEIYNNVVSGAGEVMAARGISVWRYSSGNANPTCDIHFNTVVGTNGNGISVASGVTGNMVRDNIVAGSTSSNISVSGNATSNNRTGTVESMRFVNSSANDFRLTETSPAKDQGSASAYPDSDHVGVSRPKAGSSDQGAFEFISSGSVISVPNPPALVGAQ